MSRYVDPARLGPILAAMAWEQDPDADIGEHVFAMANILREPAQYEELMRRVEAAPPRPVIVCLCGSTRFWRDYITANYKETLAGRIVLSVGWFVHPESEASGMTAVYQQVTAERKAALDELHLRKIDLADEVLFLNRGGYMGPSTRAELEYARSQGKVIRFLESAKE